MIANGLEMKDIQSRCETISTVMDIKQLVREKFTDTAYAVIYLDYEVLMGKFRDGEFIFYQGKTFEDRFVQRARIFDKDKELHIWRTNSGLNARFRTDNDGDNVTVVDARQVLFGTKSQSLNDGFTKLTEDRGTELIVPFERLSIDDKGSRLLLHTRSYVGFNEAFQAGYVDCRFIEIADSKSFKL